MSLSGEGMLLRIYVGESDRHENQPLSTALIERARREGLAGATALRGLQGFGMHSTIHSANILLLSSDLPIVIEIADTVEKVEGFLPIVEEMVPEGMATLEKIQIIFYRSHRQ
jgi:PII-like signaling protein